MKTILGMAVMAALIMGTFTATEAMAGAESKCKMCHDFGTKNKVGPGLAGIVGKKAGSTDFAKYGSSLKNANWVWNEENLRIFLSDTKTGIKTLTGDKGAKSKMKLKLKAAKLDEVIGFLKGLK